jgi:hypothetical protein
MTEYSRKTEVSIHGRLAPLLLGLWQGRNIMVEGHGGGELFISWWLASRERHEGSRHKIHA